jgi:hypothetical protein
VQLRYFKRPNALKTILLAERQKEREGPFIFLFKRNLELTERVREERGLVVSKQRGR